LISLLITCSDDISCCDQRLADLGGYETLNMINTQAMQPTWSGAEKISNRHHSRFKQPRQQQVGIWLFFFVKSAITAVQPGFRGIQQRLFRGDR